eukprot:CAMPEP_0204896630 /NCGR_PEP_ID=MMETSP1397-20131031/275_1 /ASSEMBLY_ACC=CAM_ASM_000891 /TAXON_ID=49980 /ORGANISM="Climacostomum Climacostomum virens, Strain Stock W-24" /LENGTH=636 /DNA_ID=CAMNT_0052064271 /DNA_START=244 /DNA_END=2154 /DNA_ORIENTATION=+
MIKLKNELKLFGTHSTTFDSLFSNNTNLAQMIKFKSDNTQEFGAAGDIKLPCLILHPYRAPKEIWNVFINTLLLYTVTIMPFTMAFYDIKPYSTWWYFDVFVDFTFVLDFLINFNTGFYDSEGELVLNRNAIARNYASSWLFLDFFATFPCVVSNFLSDNEVGDYNWLIRLARTPRLYRVLRISRLLKIMKNYKSTVLIERLQDLLKINIAIFRAMTFTILMMIVIHNISCFWYYSAKVDGFNPDTWVVRNHLTEEDTGTLYLACLYWTFMTLSTVGYGDIYPYTDFERLISMFVMAFGLTFFSFTVGSLASLLSSLNSKEKSLTNKLSFIDLFAQEMKLGKDLKQRLRHAVRFSADRNGFTIKEQHKLLEALPRNLRFEISLAMHSGAARCIPFFTDKDKVFVSSIVPFLSHVFVPKGEFIFLQDEHAEEMYFITNGRAAYSIQETNIIFKVLQQGSYFGEIELIKKTKRINSIQSVKDCNLLVMNKDLFEKMCKDFPIVAREIRDIARVRERMNLRAKAETEALIELKKSGRLEKMTALELKMQMKKVADEQEQCSFSKEQGFESAVEFEIKRLQESVKHLTDLQAADSEKLDRIIVALGGGPRPTPMQRSPDTSTFQLFPIEDSDLTPHPRFV